MFSSRTADLPLSLLLIFCHFPVIKIDGGNYGEKGANAIRSGKMIDFRSISRIENNGRGINAFQTPLNAGTLLIGYCRSALKIILRYEKRVGCDGALIRNLNEEFESIARSFRNAWFNLRDVSYL